MTAEGCEVIGLGYPVLLGIARPRIVREGEVITNRSGSRKLTRELQVRWAEPRGAGTQRLVVKTLTGYGEGEQVMLLRG
jgi:hypothetical protein